MYQSLEFEKSRIICLRCNNFLIQVDRQIIFHRLLDLSSVHSTSLKKKKTLDFPQENKSKGFHLPAKVLKASDNLSLEMTKEYQ